MPANTVVKTFEILKDDLASLLAGLEGMTLDTFPFE
jgi:hypothetical protein